MESQSDHTTQEVWKEGERETPELQVPGQVGGIPHQHQLIGVRGKPGGRSRDPYQV